MTSFVKCLTIIVFCWFMSGVKSGRLSIGPGITVSNHDINFAVKVAQDSVTKLHRLEHTLTGSDIDVDLRSPSHGQLIESSPQREALEIGRHAFVVNKATVYLIQKHCLKKKKRAEECGELSRNWNYSSSPIFEKCLSVTRPLQCSSTYKYRTYDGSCNHLTHPTFGKTFTGYRRLLSPQYSDGVMEPRKSVNKRSLPSARLVSNLVVPDIDKPEKVTTLALVHWTQFIANDLQHTPTTRMIHTSSSIDCCTNEGRSLSPRYVHPACQQIKINNDDPDYGQHGVNCMNYVRSLTTLNDDCTFGPANQMNQASQYLDGSTIYGSTAGKALALRTLQGGRLNSTSKNTGDFLSYASEPETQCQVQDATGTCYKSGDSRVNLHPQQTAMYTLWTREHNRIADNLSALNPHWDDETVYQESRKIVISEIQHITYHHWLPQVLGTEYLQKLDLVMKKRGFSDHYNEDEDPTVSNSFATAAIRFLNSMLQGDISLYNKDRRKVRTLELNEHFNQPGVIEDEDMMDMLLRGMSIQPSQSMDSSIVDDLTSQLYKGASDYGQDIFSLDIQRGRDHGIPSYTKFRQFCNLRVSRNFDFTDTTPDSVIEKLKMIYYHQDDVDLLVGGMTEKPVGDSLLGPTFRCLLGEQMVRSRRGDRFFYDLGMRAHSFTEDQLNEIRKTSLARVICDNSRDIKRLQGDVFKVPSSSNPVTNCDVPIVDLKLWKTTK